jgi:hypothetical protein
LVAKKKKTYRLLFHHLLQTLRTPIDTRRAGTRPFTVDDASLSLLSQKEATKGSKYDHVGTVDIESQLSFSSENKSRTVLHVNIPAGTMARGEYCTKEGSTEIQRSSTIAGKHHNRKHAE